MLRLIPWYNPNYCLDYRNNVVGSPGLSLHYLRPPVRIDGTPTPNVILSWYGIHGRSGRLYPKIDLVLLRHSVYILAAEPVQDQHEDKCRTVIC